MRVRKKKWTKSELDTNTCLIKPHGLYQGQWSEYFGNGNEIHVEIGCGKGSFIMELASRHSDINYVAIEREEHVIVSGLRASREAEHKPAFLLCDVNQILEVFGHGELGRIYINFCDPWPNRKKWAKRRLTHRGFLAMYRELLQPDGGVFFKTDNEELFDFSLAEFGECGWRLEQVTRDLHNSGYAGNVMTEYEKKFSSRGMAIYRCEAYTE